MPALILHLVVKIIPACLYNTQSKEYETCVKKKPCVFCNVIYKCVVLYKLIESEKLEFELIATCRDGFDAVLIIITLSLFYGKIS